MQILFTEEKSISKEIIQLCNEIQNCILEDMQQQEEKYSKYTQCIFKTNSFKLSFQDDFPFLDDVVLTYTVYFISDDVLKNNNISFNSSYDSQTNELKIVTYFIEDKPTLDFSESIIHEITHMYQYNIGMSKRQELYNIMIEMLKDESNIDRYYVALALYYTFPHEQDAFVHQFYKGENGVIEEYKPYIYFKNAIEVVKNNYKQNKRMQKAIHELGYSFKAYFKRLHYGLKRFERKLNNVKNYWIQEHICYKNQSIDNRILEIQNRTIWKKSYSVLAPYYLEEHYDIFLNKKKEVE